MERAIKRIGQSRKAYTKPKVTDYGSLKTLTAGKGPGESDWPASGEYAFFAPPLDGDR